MEIIPAIIAKDFAELEAKIKLVEPHVKTVQLDVMDGIFVSNVTWPYARNCRERFSVELSRERFSVDLEVHLMVDNSHQVLNEWLNSGVKRIILHWEAIKEIFHPTGDRPKGDNLIKQTHNSGKEFGVALNLETPISVLDNFISYVDLVLLMSVPPGQAGQKFDERVMAKIIALRQKYPDVKIEVDGGVNAQNAGDIIKAGADFLVMGSAIFESEDIGGTIERLQNMLATEYR